VSLTTPKISNTVRSMIDRRSARGNVLALFLISFSVLIITFVMLTMAQGGTIYANKSWAQFYSVRLADSAIYAAIGELKEGKIEFNEDVRFETDPDKYGALTFNSEAGVPYSTNNLVGNTKKTGWNGAAVPPGFCHLVAVGHHHGLEVVREAMVKDPPYPYSLASAGQIDTEHVEVFGLPAGEYSSLGPNDNLVINDADKEPSHIVSNSTASGAEKAVILGVDTKIAGDVKALGEVELDPSAVVQGLVRRQSDPQNLPNVSVEGFDPEGEPDKYNWTGAPGPDGRPVLVGRARHQGNLTIGDLDMAEGLLYIDGDVTITGTVRGKGAIVATGKITVTGSMDTNADHAALVAKDDITIHGNGPNSSKFQGLVYSEGSIDIAKTTIMGAAVSKDTVGTTKLEDVKAISVPELTAMSFDVHITLEKAKDSASKAGIGAGIGGDTDPIGIREADGTFTKLGPNGDSQSLQDLAERLSKLPGDPSWDFIIQKETGDVVVQDPYIGIGPDTKMAKNLWDQYVGEHRDLDVEKVEIFEIDLNTLISLDVELEMMYHTTVNAK